jgi:hypothetical protein
MQTKDTFDIVFLAASAKEYRATIPADAFKAGDLVRWAIEVRLWVTLYSNQM